MLQKEIVDVKDSSVFELVGENLTLREYNALVNGKTILSTEIGESVCQKLLISVDAVTDAVIDNRSIYGITTGFGGMSDSQIGCAEVSDLQSNLLTFLAAGAGAEIDPNHTRGAMLLRANVLLQGKSGIRPDVIRRLLTFFEADAVPIVRELGSIGASGDLVPLSTIARAITGQSGRAEVQLEFERVDSTEALTKLGLKPIQLRAKEGLALVNGTSFSSAIAANATIAAEQSLTITFAVQSILMSALNVDTNPFQSFVHESKPHPGQLWSAETMLQLLKAKKQDRNLDTAKPQDRYSLRCFPQYAGAIVEGIARIKRTVETEMNSVSDNPLIDPEKREFYQSGNFLGQYIGIAMDDLRRFISLLAKHIDVQIASLVAPEFNEGLSASLRGNDSKNYNMGLKGLQICGNSIVPMLTHAANPIVEHFPTHAEQFNQNVNGLSWGAANMAWKSMELYRRYLAISSLFAIQAIDLRAKSLLDHFDGRALLTDTPRAFYESICRLLAFEPGADRPYLFDDSDRWLEQDIETLAENLSSQGELVKALQPITDSFDQFCEN